MGCNGNRIGGESKRLQDNCTWHSQHRISQQCRCNWRLLQGQRQFHSCRWHQCDSQWCGGNRFWCRIQCQQYWRYCQGRQCHCIWRECHCYWHICNSRQHQFHNDWFSLNSERAQQFSIWILSQGIGW